MKEKHLHIVGLTVPYPVNYGGVFDFFYKLKALRDTGVKIHLHCFDYGRGEQPVLNEYCETVQYYKRNIAFKHLFSRLPFIVISRKNTDLLNNLLKDDYPILMEGIHCTYPMMDKRFSGRRMYARLLNIENVYYRDLRKISSGIFQKIYFQRESSLLWHYEKYVANKGGFLTVSRKDARDFQQSFGARNVHYMPLFLPGWQVNPRQGFGSYCLFHADLSVTLNEKAVLWLLDNVFADTDVPFLIAGKNPSEKFKRYTEKFDNVVLHANPKEAEMDTLIANAHIHLLPALSNTGIKLKLLNVLFNGRHIVVNNAMIDGTGFNAACHLANTDEEWINHINDLLQKPFTQEDSLLRKELLYKEFDNEKNALALAGYMFDEAKK